MLLLISCLAVAAAAPAVYDQRQDGKYNYRADVQNVVFLVAVPQKLFSGNILGLLKNAKQNDAQERSDVHVMEAFVEPSTPYRVEIGSDRSEDGRAAEVVIAGRRRSGPDVLAERDELKLLGATEQCGPDSERDPVTLTCRARSAAAPDPPAGDTEPAPQPAPEVLPVS